MNFTNNLYERNIFHYGWNILWIIWISKTFQNIWKFIFWLHLWNFLIAVAETKTSNSTYITFYNVKISSYSQRVWPHNADLSYNLDLDFFKKRNSKFKGEKKKDNIKHSLLKQLYTRNCSSRSSDLSKGKEAYTSRTNINWTQSTKVVSFHFILCEVTQKGPNLLNGTWVHS